MVRQKNFCVTLHLPPSLVALAVTYACFVSIPEIHSIERYCSGSMPSKHTLIIAQVPAQLKSEGGNSHFGLSSSFASPVLKGAQV